MNNTASPTPSNPTATPRFARLSRPGGASATGGAEPATKPAVAAADAQDAAQSEQSESPADALTEIDYDAAMAHSSDGQNLPGTIKIAKANGKNTGFYLGVSHPDGSLGGCNFLMYNVEKARNGQPKVDDAGKLVMTPNVQGRKAWANFCATFGMNPKETAGALVAYGKGEVADNPLIGIEARWDYKSQGDRLNCTLNAEGTAQMKLVDDGA